MTRLTADQTQRLAALAARCKWAPLTWAEAAFPWGVPESPLENKSLRDWQRGVLGEIQDHLQDPATRFKLLRIAVSSGHGIGKSALMSIIGNWAMTCHRGARVRVTANTEGQLRTTTSPEFAKWFKMSVSAPLFDIDILRIAMKGQAENWRCDFVPWSESNTEAFQGLHNEGKLVLVMMDEGSAIAEPVWDVIEGALTDENTVLLFIVFGNPTRNTGRFRECWRRFRSLWKTHTIDSRDVEGTDKDELNARVALHGEDSDYVRVRIRGLFPNASSRQFIPTNLVDAAHGKHLRPEQYDFAPVILTCDPAWTGDDELVIGMRQGLYFDILEIIEKNDNDVLIAQKLAAYEDKLGADAVFIDAGYGTGIKSAGDVFGRNWTLVWFGSKPINAGYVNRRAEMWDAIREWLRAGGSIPDDPVLYEDLIGPETLPRGDGKVMLESKEDMRKRHLPSPNRADALALSFAAPVVKAHRTGYGARGGSAAVHVDNSVFDPFA